MKLKVSIAAIFLGFALPSAAQFHTIAEAYEVRLSDLRLPRNTNGSLSYRPCEVCAYSTKRVSSDAQWVLDGRNVPFAEFRRGVMSIANSNAASVTVLHHLEQDRVIRVQVTTY